MKVEVKGHGTLSGNMNVMNFISLALSKAGDMYRLEGAEALAEQAKEFADEIYYTLKEKGYYENVE